MEATATAPVPNKARERAQVLLADDDDLFREGLATRLRRDGYDCTCAATANQAMELLKSKEYDVLISDIYMPGNVGLELIQSIPQVANGLPVILITGRPTLETALKSVRLSVAGYLVKPPELSELRAVLAQAVSLRRGYQSVAQSRRRLERWARDLQGVERVLREPSSPDRVLPVAQYLQLTISNLASLLEDAERTLSLLPKPEGLPIQERERELLDVLRRTVAVIEQTKQNFHSKRLAEMRRELEAVLAKTPIAIDNCEKETKVSA
jgi:YesN/AraC family two-component response regulator